MGEFFYKSETVIGTLAIVFAGLAILIACLGLFGLAAFMAEQRTKEIGVRKVLGASVTSITALLLKDFLGLVVIAILLATPLAWYASRTGGSRTFPTGSTSSGGISPWLVFWPWGSRF